MVDIKTGKGVYDETALQLAAYSRADLWHADGAEGQPPEVEAAYVAHVRADETVLVPVDISYSTFSAFLYLLGVWRWQDDMAGCLIGESVRP